MSGHMMSVDRARRLTDGGHHTVHTGLVMPAARTIAHLAEQIERLQAALREADNQAIKRIMDSGDHPEEGAIHEVYTGLLPGDMKAPE